jgi:hypothetical protein
VWEQIEPPAAFKRGQRVGFGSDGNGSACILNRD